MAADSSLADAAMAGNRAAVTALLTQKADVNAPQGDGTTALHWAAFHDDAEMVKALLAAGANPKAVTREGAITPLSMACTNGNAAVIEALLKAGADANEKNANGTTALMTAASSGSVEALRVLLDRGADLQAKESAHGQTALMFAAALDRTAAVRYLLSRGAQPNVASTARPVERVRFDQDGNIVEDRPAGGGRGGRPVSAAQQDKADEAADAAKAEEARKAALDATKSDLELLGRSLGFQSAAVTLAKPKARAGDVAARAPRRVGPEQVGGMTALLYAAREGHIETAKALLDGGADINQVSADKFSPLVMAIANGHLDLAKYLVDKGADPNVVATSGLTALYGAIDVQWAPHAWFPQPTTEQEKTSYLELMKDLLEHGANANAPVGEKLWFRSYTNDYTWVDPAGATSFWRAAQSSDIAAMHLLIDHGADPKLATKSGDTPLMAAAGIGWAANWTVNAPYNFTEAVKYCVELGNDVNAVDNRGYTALHGAAYLGKNDMVEYLVSKGAKVAAKSKAGDSPADMANGPTRFGQPHPETVALLEKLGSPNSHNCRSDQCVVQAGSSIYNRVLTAGEQAEKDTLDKLATAIGLQEAEYLPEGPARRPNGSQ
jgi:ankyrin repeat protein